MFSPFFTGGVLIIWALGFSVASAKAANVSISILIHKSMIVFKGESPSQQVPKNTAKRHEMLVVI